MQKKTRVQEIVEQLNIIDDVLFQKMAEDPGFCEETISTIMGQNVTVKDVTPQKIVVSFTPSGYGDYFCGSTQSWMYVDDIKLNY